MGHMGFFAMFSLSTSFFKQKFIECTLKEQPVDREFCKIILEFIMKKAIYHGGLPNQ